MRYGPRRFIQAPRQLRHMLEPEPDEPQYRWTFETWIKRTWRDWGGDRKADTVDHRTMTVIAPTEEEAKRKVEAALPAAPRPRGAHEVRDEEVARHWRLEGTVEEVEW